MGEFHIKSQMNSEDKREEIFKGIKIYVKEVNKI